MPDLRTMIRTVSWLLPASPWKNRLLRRLGDDVDSTASVAPNIVWQVDRIRLAAGSRVGLANQFRNLRTVELGRGARIGSRNVVSSHPVYAKLYPDGAHLELGAQAVVTDGHHLDGAGGLTLGEFAMLGGRGSQVLTHSIDLERDVQSAYPVTIGARSFVGGGCLLLGGSSLPPESLLVRGSVLVRGRSESVPGLWTGAPARCSGPVDDPWIHRVANSEPPVGPETTDGGVGVDTFTTGVAAGPRHRSGTAGPRDLARALAWLLPASPRKNALLRRLGHDLHPTARATANLVWRVGEFTMAEGSRIAEANRLVGLRSIRLGRHTTMGRWNRVFANTTRGSGGSLVMGDHTQLTGHHLIDATAGIRIDDFAIVAGRESELISDSCSDEGGSGPAPIGPAPIRIGTRSFVGTRCRLLPGARLADRSVLAAGSTLGAQSEDTPDSGVWAGTPARHRRPVAGRWFDRDQTATRRVFVPATGQTIEDAF